MTDSMDEHIRAHEEYRKRVVTDLRRDVNRQVYGPASHNHNHKEGTMQIDVRDAHWSEFFKDPEFAAPESGDEFSLYEEDHLAREGGRTVRYQVAGRALDDDNEDWCDDDRFLLVTVEPVPGIGPAGTARAVSGTLLENAYLSGRLS